MSFLGPLKFPLGSHLSARRLGYSHHGIYLGGEDVIHYAGGADGLLSKDGTIEITSLSSFSGGEPVSVIPHANSRYSGPEAARRAQERLGEDSYNLVLNNCEHFANWCIEGNPSSPQVIRAVVAVGTHHATSIAVGSLAATLALPGVAAFYGAKKLFDWVRN